MNCCLWSFFPSFRCAVKICQGKSGMFFSLGCSLLKCRHWLTWSLLLPYSFIFDAGWCGPPKEFYATLTNGFEKSEIEYLMNQTNFARKVREGRWFMLAFWLADRGQTRNVWTNAKFLWGFGDMDLLPLHLWDQNFRTNGTFGSWGTLLHTSQ